MMSCKTKLADLESSLNLAEEALALAENGASVTDESYTQTVLWVGGKSAGKGTINGKALREVLAVLKPAIDAMVLERVQNAHEQARTALVEACRDYGHF